MKQARQIHFDTQLDSDVHREGNVYVRALSDK